MSVYRSIQLPLFPTVSNNANQFWLLFVLLVVLCLLDIYLDKQEKKVKTTVEDLLISQAYQAKVCTVCGYIAP